VAAPLRCGIDQTQLVPLVYVAMTTVPQVRTEQVQRQRVPSKFRNRRAEILNTPFHIKLLEQVNSRPFAQVFKLDLRSCGLPVGSKFWNALARGYNAQAGILDGKPNYQILNCRVPQLPIPRSKWELEGL
jgi:hypothetical protein